MNSNSLVGFLLGFWQAAFSLIGIGHRDSATPINLGVEGNVKTETIVSPQDVINQYGTLPHGLQNSMQTSPKSETVTKSASVDFSVPGMSKYTDSDFGFSFWYPDDWLINPASVQYPKQYADGTVVKQLFMGKSEHTDIGIGKTSIFIIEFVSDTRSITFGTVNGPLKHFFDPSTHMWMTGRGSRIPDTDEGWSNSPADISQNTMGGLHMLEGPSAYLEYIIPLSASHFLLIQSSVPNSVLTKAFVETILATDPSVATPVSNTLQNKSVQAEAVAYGVTTEPQTYTDAKWGFSLKYPSDFKPLAQLTQQERTKAASYMAACPTGGEITNGSALCYLGNETADGFEAAAMVMEVSNTPTIEECTAAAKSTKIINGITFYYDETGDAGLGHRLTEDRYRSYFNGACYQISLKIAWDVGSNGQGGDEAFRQKIMDKMTTIMPTFKFTVPETIGAKHSQTPPEWKTISSKFLPVTFEYPGQLLAYDSDSEVTVGEGSQIGVNLQVSNTSPGSISVQKGYIPAGKTATLQMQSSMQTDPIAYPSYKYTNTTLGGETAYTASGAGFDVMYVLHGATYYRIILKQPMASTEKDRFLTSFRFTD